MSTDWAVVSAVAVGLLVLIALFAGRALSTLKSIEWHLFSIDYKTIEPQQLEAATLNFSFGEAHTSNGWGATGPMTGTIATPAATAEYFDFIGRHIKQGMIHLADDTDTDGAEGPEPQQSDGGHGDTTLAIDFDGVLHGYSKGWYNGEIYDVPVPGSREAVHALLDAGFDLVVFTARPGLEDIRDWLIEHIGVPLPVTNVKPVAALYIDDRAVRFEGDWEATLRTVSRLLEAEATPPATT